GPAPPDDDAGHASSLERGSLDVAAVEEGDVRERPDARPYRSLERRAAHHQAAEPRPVAELPGAVLEPEEVADEVAARRARGLQLVHQAGERPVEHAVAAREQAVRVVALRNTLPVRRGGRQLVAFDERH